MNKNLYIFLALSCLLLISLQQSHATRYEVVNTVPNSPGGQLFEKEIGVQFTKKIMSAIKRNIFRVFEEKNEKERAHIPVVTVYISEFNGYAYKNGNSVNVSASALDKWYFPRSSSKWFFTAVMHHEMAHVFQWHGQFTAPGWLTEGTADYVMVKSGFSEPKKYPKPGAGQKLEEGYGVVERFLEYCDSLTPSFTAKLNQKMKYKYSDSYWVELLGKPVDQLWREYKAKYGNQPQEETLDMFHGLEY